MIKSIRVWLLWGINFQAEMNEKVEIESGNKNVPKMKTFWNGWG